MALARIPVNWFGRMPPPARPDKLNSTDLMKFLFPYCLLAAMASAQTLTPVWVELGPDGSAVARTVIEPSAKCPDLRAGGQSLLMKAREPVPEGLKPVCEVLIPNGVRSLRWGKKKLSRPKTPNRVVVMGDTGCRIKGGQIQDCDNPDLWPFEPLSAQVAKLKPDLIIHVGDYLYRESACPDVVEGCAGPHGDNWEAWNADFFTPARAALAAAPWVFARGNHESCERSFRGWFYYLDPRPFTAACSQYTAPYIARSGDLRLAVLDTGATKDRPNAQPTQIPIYSQQLTAVSGRADWLVDHHPFWGYTANSSTLVPTELTLGPAWAAAQPKGISLVLSGHVHLFEFLALESGRPNQVIAGDSGTQLDTGFTVDKSGSSVAGARVKTGEVNMSFGLTEFERQGTGWVLTLRNAQGAAQLTCTMPADQNVSCKVSRPRKGRK